MTTAATPQDAPPRRPSAPSLTRWLHTVPFPRAAGFIATEITPEGALCETAAHPALGDPRMGASICRPALAALIDQAGSAALVSRLGPNLPHATLSMTVSFARDLRGPTARFNARLAALAEGLAHTLIDVTEPDGTLVAQGMVIFVAGRFPGSAARHDAVRVDDATSLGGQIITPLTGDSFLHATGLQPASETGPARLNFAPHLGGSRHPMAFHGGIIAAAMAMTAEAELAAADSSSKLRLAHLSIEYLRAARPRETWFDAEPVAQSRTTLACTITARQNNSEDGQTPTPDANRTVTRATARFHAH